LTTTFKKKRITDLDNAVLSSFLFILYHRLVEEADYKSTKELFGGGKDEKNLDTFIPKSESDFLEYAELISQRIRSFEVS